MRTMKILTRLGALGTAYSFLSSPAGRRIMHEIRRQAADPRNHQRVADLIQKLRAKDPVVVDADPPDQMNIRRRPVNFRER